MKYFLLSLTLLVSIISLGQTTCSGALALPMDETCSTLNFSSATSTGDATHCAYGTGKYMYVKFTTGSVAKCAWLDIDASEAVNIEVAFFSSSNCNSGGYVAAHSICFNDGYGIWAPDLAETYAANKTYYLRIWAPSTFNGTVNVCGKFYSPANDNCSGAVNIGVTPVKDNNACHTPGPNVIPGQLCAFTLENTAWYAFTVQSTGIASIVINKIHCNNVSNLVPGFQIGFFLGTCTGLQDLSCTNGTGTSVIATTPSLPAGTIVYMAVDGTSGSNCEYELTGFNVNTLSAKLKHINVWKDNSDNVLKWTSSEETAHNRYELQRSTDGRNWQNIYVVSNTSGDSRVERDYSYIDRSVSSTAYYRLRIVADGNDFSLSPVLVAERKSSALVVQYSNPISSELRLSLNSTKKQRVSVSVVSLSGITLVSASRDVEVGQSLIPLNVSNLSRGAYKLVVASNGITEVKTILKQ